MKRNKQTPPGQPPITGFLPNNNNAQGNTNEANSNQQRQNINLPQAKKIKLENYNGEIP